MSKLVWLIAPSLVAALATPAGAAPVGQVISACDKMHNNGQTCNYGIKGNGLVGCTDKITFECPADGSRQCHKTGSNTTGKCNEDGTIARTLQQGDLVEQLLGGGSAIDRR